MNSPTKTTGGYAMKFYTSLRLQFTGVSKEYAKKKSKFNGKEVSTPYGTHTKVKVVKNKIDAKQGASHMIFIRYGEGIDEAHSLIEAACHWGVIKKGGGGQYSWGGTSIRGREKMREFLLNNPKAFNEIRSILVSLIQGESEDSPEEESLTEAEIVARTLDEDFEEEQGQDREIEIDEESEEDG